MEHLVPVSVEILLLRAGAEGRWRYRRLLARVGKGETPDQAVRRTCGIGGEEAVVHSTSWRYQPEGHVVLTYAVCPDPEPALPSVELADLSLARGSSPTAPSPEDVRVSHVVAHALRHLAFLLVTDPVVSAALTPHPVVTAALGHLPPALAQPITL